jgi:hypothetical protein
MQRREFIRLSSGGFAGVVFGLSAYSSQAGGAPKKKGGGSSFTQFPQVNVFTQGRGNRKGMLSIELGLDTKDEKLREAVIKYTPRLRDAYITRMQAYGHRLNSSSVVDLDFISRELQNVTDTILKKSGSKVLLGTVILN